MGAAQRHDRRVWHEYPDVYPDNLNPTPAQPHVTRDRGVDFQYQYPARPTLQLRIVSYITEDIDGGDMCDRCGHQQP